MENSIAEQITKRAEKKRSDRGTWDAYWHEIAERFLPNYSNTFFSKGTPGEKKTQNMVDATGALAVDRFRSIQESMVMPRGSRYHGLASPYPEINKSRNVRLWFDQVTDLLFRHRYSPRANFTSQSSASLLSNAAFGNQDLYVAPSADGVGFRYKSVHIGSVYVERDFQGNVDTVYRFFDLTARQAEQQFKELPEEISKCLKNDPDKKFEIIHCVMPNKNRDPERNDFRGKKYASYYVYKKHLLEEGGYNAMPHIFSTYDIAPGEDYGRSPAMIALPSMRTLNEQKKTILKQGHRVVDPVLLAHDDGVLDSFSLKPGSINTGSLNKDGKRLVDVLPTGNVAVGFDMMQAEQQTINDIFLITLFQILVEQPQMTATEVMERSKEKAQLLSPTMGRLQSEWLAPQVEREIEILDDQGLLPKMPEELVEAGGEYVVHYTSPLSRIEKAEEAAGFMRTLEMTLNYVNVTQDSSPLDHFNFDTILPDVAFTNAVPARWLNSVEDIKAKREERQQMMMMDKAIEAAPAVTGAMKGMA